MEAHICIMKSLYDADTDLVGFLVVTFLFLIKPGDFILFLNSFLFISLCVCVCVYTYTFMRSHMHLMAPV